MWISSLECQHQLLKKCSMQPLIQHIGSCIDPRLVRVFFMHFIEGAVRVRLGVGLDFY